MISEDKLREKFVEAFQILHPKTSDMKIQSARIKFDEGWVQATFKNATETPLDPTDLSQVNYSYGFYDKELREYFRVDKHLPDHKGGRDHIATNPSIDEFFLDTPSATCLLESTITQVDELYSFIKKKHKE